MGFLDGITIGWCSRAIFLFSSNQSPLSSGRITVDEASWVSSLTAVGMMFSSIFVGTLAKKYGRKWPLVLLTVPSIISWALIYSAKNVYFLYVARMIQGFIAAGTFSFGQLYLIEISDYKYGTTFNLKNDCANFFSIDFPFQSARCVEFIIVVGFEFRCCCSICNWHLLELPFNSFNCIVCNGNKCIICDAIPRFSRIANIFAEKRSISGMFSSQ